MGFRLQGPARRIAVAIGILVVLVVLAVGIAIVRYGDSRSADNEALAESQTQFFAQQVRTDITDEGGIADAYGGDADPADLADLEKVKRSLTQALHSLKESPGLEPDERASSLAIAAGQRRLESIFRKPVGARRRNARLRRRGRSPTMNRSSRMEQRIDAFNRASAKQADEAAQAPTRPPRVPAPPRSSRRSWRPPSRSRSAFTSCAWSAV